MFSISIFLDVVELPLSKVIVVWEVVNFGNAIYLSAVGVRMLFSTVYVSSFGT